MTSDDQCPRCGASLPWAGAGDVPAVMNSQTSIDGLRARAEQRLRGPQRPVTDAQLGIRERLAARRAALAGQAPPGMMAGVFASASGEGGAVQETTAQSRFASRVAARRSGILDRDWAQQAADDAAQAAADETGLSLHGSPTQEGAWRQGGRFAPGAARRRAVALFEEHRRRLAEEREVQEDFAEALGMNAERAAAPAEEAAGPAGEYRKEHRKGSRQCPHCGHMNLAAEAATGICSYCGEPLDDSAGEAAGTEGSRGRGRSGGFRQGASRRIRGMGTGAAVATGLVGALLGGAIGNVSGAVSDVLEMALRGLGQTGQGLARVGKAFADAFATAIKVSVTLGAAAVGGAIALILGPAIMVAFGAIGGMIGGALGMLGAAVGKVFGEALQGAKQVLDDITGTALGFADAIMRIVWTSGQAASSAGELVFAMDAMGIKAGETAGIFGQWGMRAEFLDAKLGALGATLVRNKDGTTDWAQTLGLLRQRVLELPDMMRLPMLATVFGQGGAQQMLGKFMLPDEQFGAAMARGQEGQQYSATLERVKMLLEPVLQRVRQIASLIKLDMVEAALPRMVRLLQQVERLWSANRDRLREFAAMIPNLIVRGIDRMLAGAERMLELLPQWVEWAKRFGEIMRDVVNTMVRVLNWADRALMGGKGGIPFVPELPWQQKAPGRAAGGPVRAGQPYTVGEQGEETFVPDQDGQILNQDALERYNRELDNKTHWVKGLLATTAAGAIGGSFIPGVGTFLGGVMGLTVGLFMGLAREIPHQLRLSRAKREMYEEPEKGPGMPWGTIGGGALLGAGIGRMFGPWGMAVGGAAGAVGGYFAGRKIQTERERLGQMWAEVSQGSAQDPNRPKTPLETWAQEQQGTLRGIREDLAKFLTGGPGGMPLPTMKHEIVVRPTPYFFAELASQEVTQQYLSLIQATVG